MLFIGPESHFEFVMPGMLLEFLSLQTFWRKHLFTGYRFDVTLPI